MKALLILAGPYLSCKSTQIIWEDLCKKTNIELKIVDITHKEGQRISAELNIKSFPSLIIGNKVIAVGHPDEKSAKKVISNIYI